MEKQQRSITSLAYAVLLQQGAADALTATRRTSTGVPNAREAT